MTRRRRGPGGEARGDAPTAGDSPSGLKTAAGPAGSRWCACGIAPGTRLTRLLAPKGADRVVQVVDTVEEAVEAPDRIEHRS
ncbi:hypothetical protein ACFVHB_06495 [Kitasatospora sp. NPDC127111]|uniref:hypothetical protein n=1 Tax=Kitasatospora sp. NPDC127111 TaxID=3345363 RepID=UPI00363E0BD4